MIVDKVNSQLFLFDAGESLRATAPVLLGLARGDDSPAGIGSRKLSTIRPVERITPAGRFYVAMTIKSSTSRARRSIFLVRAASDIEHKVEERVAGLAMAQTGEQGVRAVSDQSASYPEFVE